MTPDPDIQPQFYESVPTSRLLAWVIDIIVTTGLVLLILPFTAFTGLFFLPFLFIILGFAYRVVTLSRGSATWGMRLMAIELRERGGGPLTSSTALMHTLRFAFPLIQAISVLFMARDNKGQGLTDMVLGTAMLNRAAP